MEGKKSVLFILGRSRGSLTVSVELCTDKVTIESNADAIQYLAATCAYVEHPSIRLLVSSEIWGVFFLPLGIIKVWKKDIVVCTNDIVAGHKSNSKGSIDLYISN